jgi:hypothetical protein
LEFYSAKREQYCNQVHKWFDIEKAEEKRTQTREFLNDLMNKKYSN